MPCSTNSLIAEQCTLINRGNTRKTRRKGVYNILSEQISSLNDNDTIVIDDPVDNKGDNDAPTAARSERWGPAGGFPQKSANVTTMKSSDTNFLHLLTGDAVSDGSASTTAQSRWLSVTCFVFFVRLRQQIAQNYVMKCLGGFKYIEGNAYDNFVVATLPQIDAQKYFKST
ncbi:phosphoglucomutase phosphomannomutase alpha beta subunit, putative [Babesia ovis]|uniref:Phosphoglucomutase phosphomannomutase alpha beta subunit, putative n=1 Tax=Babesia ovis TaxID=5869 RepID=A0A9W5TE71_BABOV|nr:phosphoglucomutase phosphomannomutase alpha beta subunit, putative [Babesia ovis]